MKKTFLLLTTLIPLLVASSALHGQAILVLAADGSPPSTELMNTGIIGSVSYQNASSLPSLATISTYDAVLAYTNSSNFNATAFGDLLADYVDGGGQLVLATYGFSNPSWEIGGRIQDAGYSPFSLGGLGSVDGGFNALNPNHSIFNGVNINNVSYFYNSNYANVSLETGASLLAEDGSGNELIAVNALGNVYGFNIFPGSGFDTSQDTYRMMANALTTNGAIPEPATVGFLGLLGLGMFLKLRKHRSKVSE